MSAVPVMTTSPFLLVYHIFMWLMIDILKKLLQFHFSLLILTYSNSIESIVNENWRFNYSNPNRSLELNVFLNRSIMNATNVSSDVL